MSAKKLNRRDFIKTSAAIGAVALTPAVFGAFSSSPEKTDEYYNTLADALNKLPNAFPRTESNIELQVLKKIFTPEEAWLCGQLTIEFESIDSIAERIGLSVEETRARLEEVSKKGCLWGSVQRGAVRLAPFIVGIYEAQLWEMDHELAHLVEEYFDEGGVEFMRPQPAIHRVVPAQSSTKSEWILPQDDIKALLKTMVSFRVRDCICRVQQELIGERKCDYPKNVCLNFSPVERPPSERDLSLEEALALIDETEKVGLVHSVSNVAEGFYYVCNCCGCCCGILRGITEYGIEKSVAAANYIASIDPEKCEGCGTCAQRCHVDAISPVDGKSVVDKDKCIGCGLCVTGCPHGVAQLERKPDNEIIQPPKDFGTWEHERLVNRGLKSI
ncbi:4Fe-4S binding protein [candidate division KSB1 bacterium]|nr:4Fe-4S binding protein [candidate division KSB1 bacterium]